MKRAAIWISILFLVLLIIPFLWKTQVENSAVLVPVAKAAIGDDDDINARLNYEILRLRNPVTGKIPKNIRERELKFARQITQGTARKLRKGSSQNGLSWESRGPLNRGGRTRALAVDVRTQTPGSVTLIAGGASGGIFKSTDDGQTWVNKLDPELIHNITCIAQDTRPGHEDTWYVGTGEALGSAGAAGALFMGDGIFKSTDNGETWTPLASTANDQLQRFNSEFRFVNNIAVNKTTGSIFAATSNTVVRSKDGGASWHTIVGLFANNAMSDVQITSTGIIYTAIPSGELREGIRRLTDDGATLKDITPSDFPTVFKRTVIAISPSNENIVYFFVQTPNQGPTNTQLWKYDDALASWANLTDSLPTIGGKSGTLNTQGGYDMVLKVKPDDSNFVVLGGTNLYRSTDGFTSKVDSSGWIGGYQSKDSYAKYPNHHPDQHSLVFLNSPNSSVLYSGSDGGITRTDDVTQASVTWTDLNTGYITSQFYSLAIDPATANNNIIIGGLQDNGNYYTNSADSTVPWVELPLGGDGGFTAIADGHTEYYFETQKGEIWKFRLDENGNPTQSAYIKPNYNTSYLFINPFVLDPVNNKIMYFAAGDSVFRNSDLSGISWGTSNATNKNWSVLSSSRTGSVVSAIGVSRSPANRLYIGSSEGKILRIDGADAGDPPAVDVSTGKGLPAGYVNCLYVDPDDADKVMAVFTNYSIPSLFYTTDAGSSWVDVSGNLEQNPDGSGNGPSCRWVTKLVSGGLDIYYLASSTGLYSTNRLDSNATVWQPEGPNTIGNVVCDMVVSRTSDNLIAVATHGAGVFSNRGSLSDIPVVSFPSRTDFTVANQPAAIAAGDLNADGKKDIAVVTEAYPYGLYVLLNTIASGAGIASFDTKHLLDFSYGPPSSVAIGDLNGDNRQDMAVVFTGASFIKVYINTTTPGDTALSFQETEIPANDVHSQILIGDINKDGKPDLTMSSGGTSDSLIAVFLNQTADGATSPVFSNGLEFTCGQKPSSLTMADMNQDGMPDLVCTNYYGRSFSVLFNTADSGAASVSFSAHSDVFLGNYYYPTSIGSGDINNDGIPDLVISSDAVDTVYSYLNATGSGSLTPSFSKKFRYVTGLQFAASRSVTVGDLNGDNRTEFVTANLSGNNISVFENHTTDGSFNEDFLGRGTRTAGNAPQSIINADFNGDKKPDLATANWGEATISVFLNSTEFTVSDIAGPKTAHPQKFSLAQNYPNPFNPETRIRFYLPQKAFVTLKIYNLLGQEIKTIARGQMNKGRHSYRFDGSGLASGMYIYRITAFDAKNHFSQSRKMILLK